MSAGEDLFDQEANSLHQLGLREIPFSESPIGLDSKVFQKIFTGREDELRQVFRLFQSQERRRILVYGHIGIGKSAFLLEVLSVIKQKLPKMLVT
jgi:Cdc6-like AAA superfamily ATPase